MPFNERWPEIIAANPGGADDPLGESILDHDLPWLRVYEPTDIRIVIGRNQDPTRECFVENCQADNVPIHRRVSGGGAVVLAPGTVVFTCRLPRDSRPVDDWFCAINAVLAPAIESISGTLPLTRGHGDLAMPQEDGSLKKILGASLRQTREHVYYLGVFLVHDIVEQMQRYLQSPSRKPDYRGDRDHKAFCTELSAYGCNVEQVCAALKTAAEDGFANGAPAAATCS